MVPLAGCGAVVGASSPCKRELILATCHLHGHPSNRLTDRTSSEKCIIAPGNMFQSGHGSPSVTGKRTSATKIATPTRHTINAGRAELQEARRHLRHLQDSGPRGPGSRADANPLNKVAASSSQNAPHNIFTVPHLLPTFASLTATTCISTTPCAVGKHAVILRLAGFPLGQTHGLTRFVEIGLPSVRRGWPQVNAYRRALSTRPPACLVSPGAQEQFGLSQGRRIPWNECSTRLI